MNYIIESPDRKTGQSYFWIGEGSLFTADMSKAKVFATRKDAERTCRSFKRNAELDKTGETFFVWSRRTLVKPIV